MAVNQFNRKQTHIVKKENEKLSKFIGKSSNLLKINLGNQMKILKMKKEILNLFIIQKNI